MKEYNKVYNSSKETEFKEFQLASGYISTTEIYFEAEELIAEIEASGKVSISDTEGKLLANLCVEQQAGGREVYETVLCGVSEGVLVLKFPVVEWIDNYPHCDGEHDRWDSRVIGYNLLEYKL